MKIESIKKVRDEERESTKVEKYSIKKDTERERERE